MLKTVLVILEGLGHREMSTKFLCARLEISSMTLKRGIAEARRMGAVIESVKGADGFVYRLTNWPACKDRVTTWLDLIEADSVVSGGRGK
jgi:biotin operon repressor